MMDAKVLISKNIQKITQELEHRILRRSFEVKLQVLSMWAIRAIKWRKWRTLIVPSE